MSPDDASGGREPRPLPSHAPPAGFHVGLARVDFTPEVHGVGMLGWARPFNVVRGVRTRLHARALVVHSPGDGATVALVSLELCYVTTLLRREVLARLAADHPEVPIGEAELVLSATHTHSAPGGYSHARFDNASVPGLHPAVLEAFAAGTVQAVVSAWQRRQPGALRVAAGEIPPDLPVAFNRALRAHHRNPDLPRRYGPDERHLAIDREMTVLRVEDAAGRPLGLASWFGVHCTSVHADNTQVTADNKGYAATACEEAHGPGFVALFLQGPSGDVTPNHRRWPGRPFPGGVDPDDHESARANGRIQADRALSLLDAAATAPALVGPLQVALSYQDMGRVEVDGDLAADRAADLAASGPAARTEPGAVGARMLRGTWEGPGAPWPIGMALHLATRAWQHWARLTPFLRTPAQSRWLAAHGAKAPLLAVGWGTVFSHGWSVHLVPPRFDPIVDHLAQQQHAVGTEPWLPQVLPLHLVLLGDLALVALPAEPTTQAGRRLRAAASAALGGRRVLVTGYSDDYSGYVTTPEEYERQGYEGAFTQFGRWTLPAWQTRVRRLAEAMAGPATLLGAAPALPEDLAPRVHQPRRWLLA